MSVFYFGQGPPQAWQHYIWQSSGSISPYRRLLLAGRYGLVVGQGSKVSGGLQTHIAADFEKHGIAFLKVSKDTSLKAFSCQYSFDFF